MDLEDVFRYIDDNLDRYLEDLVALCRLPTVSAQGLAIDETARHVVSLVEREGFEARILPKPPGGPSAGSAGGQPVVYAQQPGSGGRTLLLYNHYDVQPPDPLDEWTSPPFSPERRDGNLYGRGVSDNKGNIISRLLAVRALKEAAGGLPCSVKLCIEGDEEIGSPQIGPFVREHASLLRADACIWEGGSVAWDGTPELLLGVKGLLYVELQAKGANRDVHSSYGTVVPNPAWRLVWALASLKGPDERVLIDGFFDDAKPPTEPEMAALRALPDEAPTTLASLGLGSAVLGAAGLDYQQRHVFAPTCTIDGLTAGYQGPGAKTVLPARASAKVDFRLVLDQDPEDILAKLCRHLDRHGFGDVDVVLHSAERPARTAIDDPFVELCREAAELACGREPLIVPSMAGTGPLYHFVRDLGLPTVMTGVNYVGGRDHAPDEHIRIEDFRRGTRHIAAILARLGAS